MLPYLLSIAVLIIFLSALLINKFVLKNKLTYLVKILSIVGIAVFAVRINCYSSIIAQSPSSFIGLDKTLLDSKVLTVFCLLFIWLQYSAFLFTSLKGFFNFKVLNNIVKYLNIPILILNLIFLKPICIILQGKTDSIILPIFLALEIGICLALSIYHLIDTIKETSSFKEIGIMFATYLLLNIFIMPNYFLQFVFGEPTFTASVQIKGLNVNHRIVLYFNVIIPTLIYFALRKKELEFKRFILIFISCAIMIGFVVNYYYKTFAEPWAWPFHLCNTAVFIIPLVLIFKMKRLFYFTYFINVVGALFAMLMPNYDNSTNLFAMRMVTFWFNHYSAFFFPILLVSLRIFERPKLKQFIYSMIAFLGYFLVALFFNIVFTANGHSVDYFFLNSDFVADKLGLWAENLFKLNVTFEIKGITYVIRPLYQTLFFLTYVLIGLGVWFVYEEAYRIADGNKRLYRKIRRIRIDEYALKAALNGRKLSEPMDKDAGIKYELIHFSKRYATSKKFAVEDANLEVFGGEIFGFLGPNGAGKSTIIKSTVGIQTISKGNIRICGYDVATQPVEAKSQIGYVPDHYALYEKLTGREYLNYIADIYNVSQKDRDERIEKYIKLFELEKSIDNMIKTYSHGMKQKITIMSALVHEPKVWILDEPLTGLDPNSIFQVKECMKEHASKGNIVFFSSHLIDIVEKLCQRIAIIKGGEIRCVKSVEEIESSGITLEQFYLQEINSVEDDSSSEKIVNV